MTLDYKRNNGRCLYLDILNEGEEIKIHRSARKASIRFSFSRTERSVIALRFVPSRLSGRMTKYKIA